MKALDIIRNLSLERKRERFPNVPAYGIVAPNYSDKDANGLTKCIIDYFRLNGGYAVRINTQGQYNEKLGKWTKSTTKRGTADVHACLNGIHYSIEVKIGRDTLSEYQTETQEQVRAAGGRYYVAKDFQDFYNWINQRREGLNE
ncbi:VRR-NUC domain-containing protein [Pontibacter arcticus]|uniref:VRR-NUC domain-containing protein n=1 Tax=Pontibacter arcticus TaxID=2080288 RepID=A0A364RCH7_9BACT|nr:VRR-NUC domain-containing protein [Pontibacter arcticus]RAU81974.1 VRR-NUC domain-containing protein [Pontibacter arcticus]